MLAGRPKVASAGRDTVRLCWGGSCGSAPVGQDQLGSLHSGAVGCPIAWHLSIDYVCLASFWIAAVLWK
jgi:hypothetical protein